MKVILLNPTGSNPFVKAAVHGLVTANLLAEFHVPIAVFPGSILDRLSNFRFISEIKRRGFEGVLKPYTKTFPWLEIGRHVSSKLGWSRLVRHETGIFNIDSVSKNLDRRVASRLNVAASQGIKAVFSYEDVTEFSFLEAKRNGLKCLYDLPIGYWRTAHRLLKIEQDRWPEWANTITAFKDSPAKLLRKDEELRMADCIYVASSFTARTLEEFPGKLAPVNVIPYGFPAVNDKKGNSDFNNRQKIKLLFVGSLSQRKGIANLFAAVEKIEKFVHLTLVGSRESNECLALNAALVKHNWIPTLPHNEVLQLMRESDVLVFPSLFEGFGLVITEAMSQGTPVITTERTAGPDLITDGENGWLIEAGSTDALKSVIENLLSHPKKIAEVGNAALQKAKNRPWEVYGEEIAESIRKIL